jgi:superfamily I DNA/RNA helicase
MKRQNPERHARIIKDLNLDEGKYLFVEKEMARMKEQLNLIDFTDMLVDYMETGDPVPVKIAYVDEAQDLTKLQWDVIEKMFSNAEKVVVAGDDDQAVYEWAGADVKRFINFSKEVVFLDKSYRMPVAVHALAGNIVRGLKVRQEKILEPKEERGELSYKEKFTDVRLEGGELVLARTKYVLREMSNSLAEAGYWFSFKGKDSVDQRLLDAILAYNKYKAGEIEALTKRQESYFMFISKDHDWHEALRESAYVTNYYRKLIDTRGYTRARVELETFHGSKGSENSHVIIATDTSKKVEDMREIYPDMELRCLFVGVTRSSNKLTVIAPSRDWHCPLEYLIL